MHGAWADMVKVLLPGKVTVPDLKGNQRWWRMCVAASVVPFAAMLHHLVFYPRSCMLNDFGAIDYIDPIALDWFMRDPSLAWAVVLAFSLNALAQRSALVKVAVAPLFAAFLPLSIWVWDIPFSGRIVCETFHDGKFQVMGVVMHGRYLYAFGALAYAGVLAVLLDCVGSRYRVKP